MAFQNQISSYQTFQAWFRINPLHAPFIVGKGGMNMKNIGRQTNSDLSMKNYHETKGGSGVRIISTTPQNVVDAFRKVYELAVAAWRATQCSTHCPPWTAHVPMPQPGDLPPICFPFGNGQQIKIRVFMTGITHFSTHKSNVGFIIGFKGQNIKRIAHETGCDIRIVRDDERINFRGIPPECSVFTIKGPFGKSNIENAIAELTKSVVMLSSKTPAPSLHTQSLTVGQVANFSPEFGELEHDGENDAEYQPESPSYLPPPGSP